MWDLKTGRELHTLKAHCTSGLALTPDGIVRHYLWRKGLSVWDLNVGRELRKLKGHSDSALSIALTSDGQQMVTVGGCAWPKDCKVKVWDLKAGRVTRRLTGHSENIHDVKLCDNDRQLVSASSDKTIKLWGLDSGTSCEYQGALCCSC